MNRLNSIIVALVTATFSWLVYYYVAEYFGSRSPAFIATVLIASVFVHELGHLIAMEWNGIKAHVFFLVLMGGTTPWKGYKDRHKNLDWNRKSAIALAGPIGTAAVVLGTFLLFLWDILTTKQLGRVANLNGLLLYFNLLPFWTLDGGRFAKMLFDSVPEDSDHSYSFGMGLLAVAGTIVVLLAFRQNFIFTAWLFAWGINYRARADDPLGSRSRFAMNPEQTRFWATAYVVLFLLGVTFAASSPDWMK